VKRAWALLLGLAALSAAGCPEPLPPIEDPDAFELDIPPQGLQGVVKDEPWSLLQSFAFEEAGGGYTLFFAPAPVTACERGTGAEEGVVTVYVAELGLQPWSADAVNELTLPDGASLSTEGGGIDLDLDAGGGNLEGGMIFDFDVSTKLEGEFLTPICP